jgi:tetratricopeptide (TPR) repeat protein
MKTLAIAIAFTLSASVYADKVYDWGGTCLSAACTTASGVLAFTLRVSDPTNVIHQVFEDIQDIIGASPNAPIADKLEDAAGSAAVALIELNESPPDLLAALGNLEGAVGDLEAALSEGLDPAVLISLMTTLANAGRHTVQTKLDVAISGNGHPPEIAEAEYLLTEGDALRDAGAYKDAVSKYKDALAKSESPLG